MYLLIPFKAVAFHSIYINLHPTMYLLIPTRQVVAQSLFLFTSHYVSINSNLR